MILKKTNLIFKLLGTKLPCWIIITVSKGLLPISIPTANPQINQMANEHLLPGQIWDLWSTQFWRNSGIWVYNSEETKQSWIRSAGLPQRKLPPVQFTSY